MEAPCHRIEEDVHWCVSATERHTKASCLMHSPWMWSSADHVRIAVVWFSSSCRSMPSCAVPRRTVRGAIHALPIWLAVFSLAEGGSKCFDRRPGSDVTRTLLELAARWTKCCARDMTRHSQASPRRVTTSREESCFAPSRTGIPKDLAGCFSFVPQPQKLGRRTTLCVRVT